LGNVLIAVFLQTFWIGSIAELRSRTIKSVSAAAKGGAEVGQ
jgi:hypothetical protein